jgi:hypothetical protein
MLPMLPDHSVVRRKLSCFNYLQSQRLRPPKSTLVERRDNALGRHVFERLRQVLLAEAQFADSPDLGVLQSTKCVSYFHPVP